MSKRRCPSREDYTVGWMCALPVELAAAREMLDEEHETLDHDANENNIYTLGRVGEHNVVIACLPAAKTGLNSATAVAVEMNSVFPSIRFGLMVGIGGGVPSVEADIRLGDVVVSSPHKQHGGVVQYDLGKATPSGFEQTGFINSPPRILLNAVSNIQANQWVGKSRFSEYFSKLTNLPAFARENAGPDVLFTAEYDHEGGATCEPCSKEKVIERQSRSQEIMVHYGTIASGNQIIRDGATRDRISLRLGGVLCFEMEAAGLMDSFPCLVIRGICDYADSHKNKRWQPYAAGTAAAYAKEVLSVIPAAEVAKSRTIDDIQETLIRDIKVTSEPSHLVVPGCLIPAKSDFLGSLTTDSLFPRQDFHVLPPPPSASQVDMIVWTNDHRIKTSSNRLQDFLERLVNLPRSPSDFVEFDVHGSRCCILKNSGEWFENLCAKEATRRWVEKQSTPIYLVVGFRSFWHRSISVLSSNENDAQQISFFPGELVYAVQYRELKFRWFQSRNLDSAQLQRGNCWQSLFRERGEGDDEEDVIQAGLLEPEQPLQPDGKVYIGEDNEVFTV